MPEYLTEYNSQWPSQFEQIRDMLLARLSSCTDECVMGIEHVGSTSIPHMPAKPIIDIDVVVLSGKMDAVITALSDAG